MKDLIASSTVTKAGLVLGPNLSDFVWAPPRVYPIRDEGRTSHARGFGITAPATRSAAGATARQLELHGE